MRTEWFRGCTTEEEKAARRKEVLSHKPVLDLLMTILKQKLKENESGLVTKAGYESPSWPYLQADTTGVLRTIKDLIDLTNVSDQEE